jgi:hypothetical protein
MEGSENKDLEKFIHAQLQKLPEREAPESLLVDVMAAIAARKEQPWWKQSFSHWPRRNQYMLFAALAVVFIASLYGTGRAAESVSGLEVSEQLSSYAWVWRTTRSIAEGVVLALANLSTQWWLAIALVLASLYAACLAAGFALFKVTSAAGSSAG